MFEAARASASSSSASSASATRTSRRTSTRGARWSPGSRRPSRSSRSPSSASTSSCPTPTCRSPRRSATRPGRTRSTPRSAGSIPRRSPTRTSTSDSMASPAILVPGGFGHRGIEGKVLAAHFAREHRIPYLGLCLGLQCAVIEFAREVVGTGDANSTEFDMFTEHPVIDFMPDQRETGGQGRHDAPRPLPGQADARLEGRRGLRPGGHLRAPPPPLRGQQPLPPDARGGRHDPVRPVARRPAGRDRRAAATTRGSWPASSTPSSSRGPSGRTRCSMGSSPRRSPSATGASRSSARATRASDARSRLASSRSPAPDLARSRPSVVESRGPDGRLGGPPRPSPGPTARHPWRRTSRPQVPGRASRPASTVACRRRSPDLMPSPADRARHGGPRHRRSDAGRSASEGPASAHLADARARRSRSPSAGDGRRPVSARARRRI